MTSLLAFIVTIGILVTIHEYGHYIVARFFDVKILRFSIGFGKPIYRRLFGKDNAELVIAAIPLGGYVKMLDDKAIEEEGAMHSSDLKRSFNQQSVYKRIAIVLAGPIFNLLLAILLYWGLLYSGVVGLKPYINAPMVDSAAYQAGLKQGDLITNIDGVKVTRWQDVRWQLMEELGSKKLIELTVLNEQSNTQQHQLSIEQLDTESADVDPLVQLGLAPYQPTLPPVIGMLSDKGAATLAGLKSGDLILKVDEKKVVSWLDFVEIVRTSANKPLNLLIERQHVRKVITLKPKADESTGILVGKIGAAVAYPEQLKQKYLVISDYSVGESLVRAVGKTWDTAWFSLKMLGQMLTGNVSWKMMSGPVTIADYAGQSASMGVKAFIGFLALMSISIGVLNLLPVPMLDGGHFMYYVIEIFLGRPVPESVLLVGQKIGLALIGLMMMLAFYNDINRLVSG